MKVKCSTCRRECGLVYVVQGYIGTYYECHSCYHGLPPEPELELITDSFRKPDRSAGLDAILDKLTGEHG